MFGPVGEGKGPGVPPGIYNAEFIKVDPVPENKEKGFKPAFMFSFKVLDGEHAGGISTRIPNGDIPKTSNALGRFLAELTSIPLAAGVLYDDAVAKAIGKPFTLVVKEGPNGGGTRVDTVMPKK